jgi:hypothetical protein
MERVALSQERIKVVAIDSAARAKRLPAVCLAPELVQIQSYKQPVILAGLFCTSRGQSQLQLEARINIHKLAHHSRHSNKKADLLAALA